MKMSGEEIIPASIETVWAALNDVDVLKQCIPGCESITKKSNTELATSVNDLITAWGEDGTLDALTTEWGLGE